MLVSFNLIGPRAQEMVFMALPRQVQAAAEAADAYLAQQAQAAQAPAETAPPPEPDAPEPTQASAEPQPAAPETQQAPQSDIWRERYNSLQGLFNKEVPSLQGRVKTLEGELKDAIERLNKASEGAESKQVQPGADAKDVENFGSDLVDMVNRVTHAHIARAAAAVEARFAEVGKRLDQLGATTNENVAMTAEQVFFSKLNRVVPDWESTNADQRFLAWLAEVDPVYGVARQAALTAAREKLDVERVAAVFSAFTKAHAPAKADPLDKQVSPRSAASAAPTPTTKRVVSQSDITKFYDDVRRGVYRGREQQAAQLEAEFNLALAEGRVR